MGVDFKAVTAKIRNIDPATVLEYLGYWDVITPRTLHERYLRWLFAALSVRTGWKPNVRYYQAVTTQDWHTEEELREVIHAVGHGLYNAKVSACWGIHQAFMMRERNGRPFLHPREAGWKVKNGRVRWGAWRNRLRALPHCGMKTISFALEMCWPRECEVVAVDRHVARWYGLAKSDALTDKRYKELENHWISKVRERREAENIVFPSAIVRHILWDVEHGRTDTHYWSHVFNPLETVKSTNWEKHANRMCAVA